MDLVYVQTHRYLLKYLFLLLLNFLIFNFFNVFEKKLSVLKCEGDFLVNLHSNRIRFSGSKLNVERSGVR